MYGFAVTAPENIIFFANNAYRIPCPVMDEPTELLEVTLTVWSV